MKLKSIALTLAAAGSFVASSPSPHRHHHHHLDKKSIDTKVITVEKYEIGGREATLQEVCEGIKSGKLATSNGAILPQCSGDYNAPDTNGTEGKKESIPPLIVVPSASAIDDKETSTPTTSSSAIAVESTSSAPAPPSSSASSPPSPLPVPSASPVNSPPHSSPVLGGHGLDREFPSGEIDCSDFPSDYGPIEVDWMGIGGWTGIQYVTIEGSHVTHIDTAVPGGTNCSSNAMCSYACPEGYQKSQWPAAQGSTGESVGGLSCNSNGKLELTNPGLSKKLCIQGTGSTNVQNNIQSTVAICRTDYPGTENEVVPLNTQPGSTHELTCPDSSSYFHHDGAQTTAQYYVNRKGIPLESACKWGKDGTSQGNWAPTVFGVGRDADGKTWLSITTTTQNRPISYKPLDYTVTLKGDHLSTNCRVQNGKYCWGDNFESCNESGCTVELLSGSATYVISD